MFRIVSSSFLSTLHTSINRPAHWICHTRLMVNPNISRSIRYHPHHTRQASTILYQYYSWPPSIRGPRTVDWLNERSWHTKISTMCFRHGQTSTATKNPSIRVPICAVLISYSLWQVIRCHHPLYVFDGNIRSGTHYLIGRNMRYRRILREVIIINSRYGIPEMSSMAYGLVGYNEFRGDNWTPTTHHGNVLFVWTCELIYETLRLTSFIFSFDLTMNNNHTGLQ